RYWGEPFPLIHAEDGEIVLVPEADLPVALPETDTYQPSGTGESPLAVIEDWVNVTLPDGRKGRRETNTMPQWAGSCWYYLRYLDPHNAEAPFSREAADYWLPVDLYLGGDEHAVLHLLYARFWHKVLFDLGYVGTQEPFRRLIHQGLILGATYLPRDKRRNEEGEVVFFMPGDVEEADGQWTVRATGEPVDEQWEKMSKSRGNVVNPDDVVERYGADTLRLYEMFMGPLEHSAPWQPEGVGGCFKFLKRVHALMFSDEGLRQDLVDGQGSARQRKLLHRTIQEVTERIERMQFNTAISSMMVFTRDLVGKGEPPPKGTLRCFTLLLAPFAPHLAEELWAALGNPNTLAREPWPEADESMLVEDTWTCVVQIRGKRRAELQVPANASKDEVVALVMGDTTVQRHVGGREPRRVIYVPNRLVNIVV
ncbi:MAG: class I tRNA ligase family protein, partial [Myxococcales bacterium]|nr:class I tRNA ligase family protein [Myxococcales bacterium]